MRDGAGLTVMWIGSNTDIETRKQAEAKLEQTVAERTAKLRETIGELESFSYSIAHDMRAPLRSLQGFSDLLLQEHSAGLAPEGQAFLRRIATAAARMDKLIQDVLNYSRIVRGELPLERVDVAALVRSIVETYPPLSPEHAEIVVDGEFPPVLGNEAMLTQVLSNLLGNAVKFVAPGELPRVCVSAAETDDRVRFSIQDNGIGIPASQHAKIFEIFQQAAMGYGGTGIGLAIVKKAVERMGGRVGVESTPGAGSTFWFEIQRA
jgi:signal transduction histidine kinase